MADMTVLPNVLPLTTTLQVPLVFVWFPTLSRSPGHTGYTELLSDGAVIRGRSESGYPVANKQFTFDPRTWQFSLYSVSQVDKAVVMAFYETHKDIPFMWYNKQENTNYEVMFVNYPECRIQGRINLWQLNLTLIQTSPL